MRWPWSKPAKAWHEAPPTTARASPLALVALLLAAMGAYWLVLPYRVDVLRPLNAPVPAPTGDEPYYLEMALSLLRHGTLDLTLIHDVEEGYREFYPDDLLPHRASGPQPHVSKHYPGVAVLIAPSYWLGDRLGGGIYGQGRMAAAAAIGVVAALIVLNMYLLALESGASEGWSLTVATLLGMTSPVLSYSFLIFPELPAGLLTVYAFRRGRLSNGPWRTILVGLAIGGLPWLHPRLMPVSFGLAALFFLRQRRARRQVSALLIPCLVSAIGFIGYDLWAFGSPLPNAGDHAGFTEPAEAFVAAVGLLIDQQWGLLPYNPALAVAGLGAARLMVLAGRVRTFRADLIGLVAVALPYCLLIASYRQWWGEWGPPARYLTPILPLAALLLAHARLVGLLTRAVALLLLVPSLVVGVLFVLWPRAMYNHPTGKGELWAEIHALGLPDVTPYLPSLVAPQDSTPTQVTLWLLLLTAIVGLLSIEAIRESAAR